LIFLFQLENIVTAAVAVKEDYRRLQGTDLVEENKELREAVYQKTNENFKLEKENQSLKTENRDLKAHISDLRAEFGVKI